MCILYPIHINETISVCSKALLQNWVLNIVCNILTHYEISYLIKAHTMNTMATMVQSTASDIQD